MESTSVNATTSPVTDVKTNGFLNKMGNIVSNHGKLSFVIIVVLLIVIIVLLYRSGSLPYFSSKKSEDIDSSTSSSTTKKSDKTKELDKLIEAINDKK